MAPLDEALLLFKKALEDKVVVDKFLADVDVSDSIWGFHAQQAAEKFLKSVLTKNNALFPKTHDLLVLCQLLEGIEISMPFGEDELALLEPFAVDFRYDSDEKLELNRAPLRDLVSRIHQWAGMQLGTAI